MTDDATKVTPSKKPMTDGQIDKVVANIRALLQKRRAEFPSGAVQIAFEVSKLADEMVAPLRKRVEAESEMIVRRVTVNRTQAPQAVLDATRRKQYTDKEVVGAMPKGEGEEVEVCFFPLKKWTSNADVEAELERRGLTPDPYAQAQVNKESPEFADTRPNGTQWKGDDGKYYFAAFDLCHGERLVGVRRDVDDWRDPWWRAGSRKISPQTSES